MSNTQNTDTVDLKAIFRKLRSNWYWFALSAIAATAGAAAYIKTTPKTYLASSTILMSEKARNTFGARSDEFIKGTGYLSNDSPLEDQIAVLTSSKNVIKALKRLDFYVTYFETKNFLTVEKYDYPPFYVKLDSSSLQMEGVPIYVSVDRNSGNYSVTAKGNNVHLYNIKQDAVVDEYLENVDIAQTVAIGKPFEVENLSFKIDFPEDRTYSDKEEYHFIINSTEGLMRHYRGSVGVAPVSDESNIVILQIAGGSVTKQVNFLNKLMESYIESEQYKRQQKGIKTINFIDNQISGVSDSLKQVESSMENFRGNSGGMMSAETSSDMLFQERSRLEDSRQELSAKKQYCMTILTKLRSSDDFRNVAAPSSSGIDDPVLNNLVIQLTQLYSDLAAENMNTVKSNPRIMTMERKIRNIKGSLVETAEGLVQQAEINLSEVNRRLGSINYQFNKLPENERRLVNIERQFKLSDNLYNYLMEKRAEAGIAIAADQVDKTVIDEARQVGVKAISPNKKVVLGGSLLLGLIIPLGFILIRDLLNDKIEGLDELKRISRIPVLSTIPTSKRKRITLDEPKSMLAESFRTARINLQYLNASSNRDVIGFTSSTSGEGKTFCAINMATIMAISGKKTLILDADMRRPRVAETLGMTDEGPGLSTYLIDEAQINDIIRPTDIPGLDMIMAGPIPPNPLELMEAEHMSKLFDQLKSRYDRIIVDASPMGLVSEFVILMGFLDVTLYVVRQGYTKKQMLKLINEHYETGKVKGVNLLLNDVKAGSGYSSEGYGYYEK